MNCKSLLSNCFKNPKIHDFTDNFQTVKITASQNRINNSKVVSIVCFVSGYEVGV